MLVGFRVDELDRDAHLVAGALHSAFDDCCHIELCADFPQVFCRFAVLVDRGSRDYPERIDIGQTSKQVVVYAVGKKLVIRIAAAARKRQNRNRVQRDHCSCWRIGLVSYAGDIERNGHTEGNGEQRDDNAIGATTLARCLCVAINFAFELDAVRSDLENPCEQEGNGEADEDNDHVGTENPIRYAECRKQDGAGLDQNPGDECVGGGEPQDVTASQFSKK